MKPKILIVDDESDLQVLFQSKYRKSLKNNEMEFFFASNGVEALALLQEHLDLNIILTDINMPVMDGLTLLTNLSKMDRVYKAIVISAYGDMVNIRSAMNRGASDFVTKPIDFDDFEITLKKLIEEYDRLTEAIKAKTFLQEQTLNQVELFKRFVPTEFLDILAKESILEIALGDYVKLEMSVLFLDIRDFTSISESVTPEEIFTFVNAYIHYVESAIHENNGFIMVFIGDAVMALFINQDDALKAALGIQQKIAEFNKIYKDKYKPVASGIGLHNGTLMLGIVGVNARLQGTVISDVVNVASRMEDIAAKSNGLIIASESFIASLKDQSYIKEYSRSLGKIQIKGKKEAIPVIEIFSLVNDPAVQLKLSTKELFREGLELFLQKKFVESRMKFLSILEKSPNDVVVNQYLIMAMKYELDGAPDSWENVTLREQSEKRGI